MRVAVAAALLALLAGCGQSEEDRAGQAVQRAQLESRIAEIQLGIFEWCAANASTGLAPETAIERDVDRLIAVWRDHPDASYDGQPLGQVLSDTASDLEGCGGPVRRIDRALNVGP